jgi:hypothetical protein
VSTNLEPVGKEFQLVGEILRFMKRGQGPQAAVAHITNLRTAKCKNIAGTHTQTIFKKKKYKKKYDPDTV